MLNNTEQFWQLFNNASSLAIIANREPWGDSLASARALTIIAQKLDKTAEIYAWQSPVESFTFLPNSEPVKSELKQSRDLIISLATNNAQINKVKYKLLEKKIDFIIEPKQGFFQASDISITGGAYSHDLIVTLNVQDTDSLGDLYRNNTDFFYSTPIINLDVSPANEKFGQVNSINLNATSCSEIIFNLIKELDLELMSKEIATCLLAGIISRTKSFKTDNVTPHSLMITAELIQHGADRETIISNLYRNRNINTIKLWGRLLSSLNSHSDESLLYTIIDENELNYISDSDISQIVDELIIQIPETKIITIFINRGNTTTLVVASPKNIDCQLIISKYEPYGSKKIAWAEIVNSLEDTKVEILKHLEMELKRLSN